MNNEWVQWIGVVILAGLIILSKLVRSLLVHQQKMTQLLQEGRNSPQIEDRILRELVELRSLVAQQAVAIDKIREQNRVLTQGEPGENRLNV